MILLSAFHAVLGRIPLSLDHQPALAVGLELFLPVSPLRLLTHVFSVLLVLIPVPLLHPPAPYVMLGRIRVFMGLPTYLSVFHAMLERILALLVLAISRNVRHVMLGRTRA